MALDTEKTSYQRTGEKFNRTEHFRRCSRCGDNIVLELLSLLDQTRFVLTKVGDKEGDILDKKLNKKIEVKYDIKSDKTGNFFLEEKAFKGSKSPIWVIADKDSFWWFTYHQLKELKSDKDLVSGGDWGKTTGWLIPKEEAKKKIGNKKIFKRK